ncbi:hypothetical protein JCM8547_005753 [Rhodosporidiobolus lusitaniae]
MFNSTVPPYNQYHNTQQPVYRTHQQQNPPHGYSHFPSQAPQQGPSFGIGQQGGQYGYPGGQQAMGGQPQMGVGSQAGDFELFGASPPQPAPPAAPFHFQSQQQQQFRQPYQQSYHKPLQQQHSYPISIPPSTASSSRSSISSSSSTHDFPSTVPDLVPDHPESPSSAGGAASPPSPRFDLGMLARPPFLSAAVAASTAPMENAGQQRKQLGAQSSFGAFASLGFGSGLGGGGGYGAGGGGGAGFTIERPASVPLERPQPVKRKTQERRDWPSFYSSGSSTSSSSSGGQYMPFAAQQTDEPLSYSGATPSQQQQQPFDASSLALSPAIQNYPHLQQHDFPSSSAFASAPLPQYSPLPHTDHPLLPSEQSDLLDRVRRDLLELDVDLSSIKGPLRALALAGGGAGDRDSTPTPTSVAAHLTPKSTVEHSLPLKSPATATLQAEDAALSSSVGTVSPQEAFLDYSSVDSRLHDPTDPLFLGGRGGGMNGSGEFGVGVGGSLFAPLPGQQLTENARHASPAPVEVKARTASPAPSSPKSALLTGSPAPSSSSATHPSSSRRPHPFSVPQNAVTWAERRSRSGLHWLGGVVDGDADDDDGDFTPGEEAGGEGEDEERTRREEAVRVQAGLGAGFARFRKEDANLKVEEEREEEERKVSEEEQRRYGLDGAGKPVEDEENPFDVVGAVAGKKPVLGQQEAQSLFAQLQHELALQQQREREALEGKTPTQQNPHSGFDFSSSSLSSSTATRPLPAFPTLDAQSGTNTPRRTAAASALAGLNPPPPSFPSIIQQPPPPASSLSIEVPAPYTSTPGRPQRQRKRSRRAGFDDSDDEYNPEGPSSAVRPSGSTTSAAEDGGHDSDGSYHSSASSFAGPSTSAPRRSTAVAHSSAPPTKRRRRQPNASSASSSALNTDPRAIRCDHVSSSTGLKCGVAFRRPYDLARHKETIHGEGLEGGKLERVKEWRCAECGGTFSRKDALLRHGRIRGHTTGV